MKTRFQTLLRTGKLHQLEAAYLALREAGVPHCLREELASGIRMAMPLLPSPGPGTWWTILVPESRVEEAREVIGRLPFAFTTNPEIWDCGPSRRGRRFIQAGAWAFLLGLALLMVLTILRAK